MGRREYAFEVTSRVEVGAETVWAEVSTMRGVNRELWPWFRMTYPAGLKRLDPEVVPLGQRAFRSWLLLFGIVPVDYDDLTIVELEPGRRFLERSTMLSQRVWEHERIVEDEADGARVTDRVRYAPRVGMLGGVYLPIFRAVFWWRHRQLRRRFR